MRKKGQIVGGAGEKGADGGWGQSKEGQIVGGGKIIGGRLWGGSDSGGGAYIGRG